MGKKSPLSSPSSRIWENVDLLGTRQHKIRYIHNVLISVKDRQKEEFDLDETVSDFLQYYDSKKHSTTKHTPLDIISAANNDI